MDFKYKVSKPFELPADELEFVVNHQPGDSFNYQPGKELHDFLLANKFIEPSPEHPFIMLGWASQGALGSLKSYHFRPLETMPETPALASAILIIGDKFQIANINHYLKEKT